MAAQPAGPRTLGFARGARADAQSRRGAGERSGGSPQLPRQAGAGR
nr:hypothetical protein [Tanacetum cinerariifolium]